MEWEHFLFGTNDSGFGSAVQGNIVFIKATQGLTGVIWAYRESIWHTADQKGPFGLCRPLISWYKPCMGHSKILKGFFDVQKYHLEVLMGKLKVHMCLSKVYVGHSQHHIGHWDGPMGYSKIYKGHLKIHMGHFWVHMGHLEAFKGTPNKIWFEENGPNFLYQVKKSLSNSCFPLRNKAVRKVETGPKLGLPAICISNAEPLNQNNHEICS